MIVELVPESIRRRWRQQPPEDTGEDAAVGAPYQEPRAIQGSGQAAPIQHSRDAETGGFAGRLQATT